VTSQAPRHPRLAALFGIALLVSLVLYARSPGTGFVFDEQEAILANPFLQGPGPWLDAFRLDFWGLPVERTIGSYRPLPNLLWRSFAWTLRLGTPFCLQLLGPLLHAVAALLLYRLLRRYSAPLDDWSALVGAGILLTLGIATEAVVTVVGQADVLVAIWTLLGLLALELPWGAREGAVFVLCLLGLLSKETMTASLPLLALAQLVLPGPQVGRLARASRVLGVLVAGVASVAVLVLLRRHLFLDQAQTEVPALALPNSTLAALVQFFEQPPLPIDPQNNPLQVAPFALRLPTALGIYASSVLQMIAPFQLTADYSFPREIPHGWNLRALLGALCFLLPLSLGVLRTARTFWNAGDSTNISTPAPYGSLLTLGLLWLPVSYLPISNLLVLLPTIRAERLLYVPAIGLCISVAALWPRVSNSPWARRLLMLSVVTSAIQARAHTLHYESDVLFWRAAAQGFPASAKAHLNLGVMLGARGDREGRIRATQTSVELAPNWHVAHVYLGDALCRAGRAREGIPHYARGLTLAPDHKDTAALALQCLWDVGEFERARPVLERAAASDPNGWLGYLLREVTAHGAENHGVPSKYRPRGYNEKK
jgi:tetratricopeptide (TPR) repeat protein